MSVFKYMYVHIYIYIYISKFKFIFFMSGELLSNCWVVEKCACAPKT